MPTTPKPPSLPDPPEDDAEHRITETIREETSTVKETVKDEAVGISDYAAQQASDLADLVKKEAAAVTSRVEKRAEDLEERRVEHRIAERGEQRSDLKEELQGIVSSIGLLIQHMDQSLPEERMKQLADSVLAEERISRKELTTKITGFLVLIVLLVASSLWLSAVNNRTLSEARKVATYIENCVQHPERLTPEQRVELCGPSDTAAKAVSALIKYQNCAFLSLPNTTEAKLNDCSKMAFGN